MAKCHSTIDQALPSSVLSEAVIFSPETVEQCFVNIESICDQSVRLCHCCCQITSHPRDVVEVIYIYIYIYNISPA